MMIMFFVFFLGLVMGSFIYCLAYRYPKYDLLSFSICDKCHHRLYFKDMFPIVSFVLLKGKCRYCHNKISLFSTLIEISFGISFLIFFIMKMSYLNYVYFSCFILISLVDFRLKEIPDLPLVTMLMLALLNFSIEKLIVASIVLLILLPFNFMNKIGFGDTKLLFIMALTLPVSVLPKTILCSTLSAIVYYFFTKKKELPFGPFLSLGFFIYLLVMHLY